MLLYVISFIANPEIEIISFDDEDNITTGETDPRSFSADGVK